MKAFAAVMRMVIAGVLMAIAGAVAAQQDYPVRPIRIIVPYPPGGSVNFLARVIDQRLAEDFGQQVIVDNRGGGNTVIGAEQAAKSAPDGYTLFLAGSTQVALPSLYSKLPYDLFNDFSPVATIARGEFILVLHPSVPASNLQQFIALAKAKPGQLNYGSSSTGGPTHLSAVLFEMLTGVKMQHIPYKGGGPAISDLMGGQIQLTFGNPANVIPFIKSGRLKAIAVSGETRLAALPQVPTFVEAGLAGLVLRNWYGLLVPSGTPKAIIDKLAVEIGKILKLPSTEEALVKQGLDTFISTPEQLGALMRTEKTRIAAIIKAGNITIEH